MTGKTTPLYIVCSPFRCVGTTTIARLLTEFYILDNRPVAAFDLADEGPQLIDYLPKFTTVADIRDIRDQMAFFERLIVHNGVTNIVDLSHRMFENFFTIVGEIGFFEEARRHSIEPLILFIIDPDPNSLKAYINLRGRLTEASLLPICNQIEASSTAPPHANTAPASLEIPLLGFSLRALIDQQSFSFCELLRITPTHLREAPHDELRHWVEDIFFQFRELELMVGCVDASMRTAVPASRRPRPVAFPRSLADEGKRGGSRRDDDAPFQLDPVAIKSRSIGVPYEILRFAPKKARADTLAMDQFGDAIVNLVQSAGQQLRVAADRINELETEIERTQHRAVRAETSLQVIGREIEKKLVEPAAASRSKIDDLGRGFDDTAPTSRVRDNETSRWATPPKMEK
jgi:hypothetical protein